MSRMTLALCLLAVFSPGCTCIDYVKYNFSLATARMESMGPSCGGRCDPCGAGGACIPSRPFTPGYCEHHDFYITRHTAQRCAFRSLTAYRRQSGESISHHFKMGFITAYEDIAFNRIPSVAPPPKYWNAFFRSPAGQGCVQDWFAGYDAGREMGQNNGVARFGQVALRRGYCPSWPPAPMNSVQPQPQPDDGMYLQSRYATPGKVSPVSYRSVPAPKN